jgi:hypothetical protein
VKVVLTITMEIDGDDANAVVQKIDHLLPDTNGLIAAGMAAALVRNLTRCGMAAGYPRGWNIAASSVEVRRD